MAIKVAIVDDEERVRMALRNALSELKDLRYWAGYADAREALRAIPKAVPDVVLMDIRMPQSSGIDCTRKLKAVLPHLPVVMHTSASDRTNCLLSLMAGADGYLIKPAPVTELVEAIFQACKGTPPLSPGARKALRDTFCQNPAAFMARQRLSPREQQVMLCLLEGCGDKEIADRLRIEVRTAQNHVARILQKVQASSRQEAVHRFLGL